MVRTPKGVRTFFVENKLDTRNGSINDDARATDPFQPTTV